MKKCLTVIYLLGLVLCAYAEVEVSEIYLSADKQLHNIYINGEKVELKADSTDFSAVRNLGPHKDLKSISVRAEAGDEGGFIAMLTTASGLKISSDKLWKSFHSKDGSEPPKDQNGKSWFHPEYDDSNWKFATEDGRFGIPPWNTGKKVKKPFKTLLETMRVYNDKKVLFRYRGSSLNAKWIWHGNASYPAKYVYFRRSFSQNEHNIKTPPTSPYGLEVSKVTTKKAQLKWFPSFSHLGPVKYQIYWNGLHIETTDVCEVELTGLRFSSYPNNYVYVIAVDQFGNLSDASKFQVVKVKDKTPPEPPKNPMVIRTGPNMIELSWLPGSDETALRGYTVNVGKIAFIAPPGATEFKYSGKMLKPDTEYDIQIFSRDLDNNKSKPVKLKTRTSKKGIKLITPPNYENKDKTKLKLSGLTNISAVFRWNRLPANSTQILLRILDKGKVFKEVPIPHPGISFTEIKALKSGINYTAKLEYGLNENGKKIISDEVNFTTVKLPETKPLKLLASLTTPDSKPDNFKSALIDAQKEDCEFMIAFGNYGPQDRAQDKHWEKFMGAVNLVKKKMPVFMAPSSHDTQDAFLDPVDSVACFSSGKYNRYTRHTGFKLNEIIDLGNTRIIWSMSKTFGNDDGDLFFQNTILDTNKRTDISHVFVLCAFQENIADWERILVNSTKPVIILDRYINGNPGYAITWEPGMGFIQVSSQRNRANSADYQKIHIYQDKIFFEQRAKDPQNGKYKTTVIHEIEFNRKKQKIKPTMIRNRHTSGMVLGFNTQVGHFPWAKNAEIKLGQDLSSAFALEGTCPLGKSLKFEIIKQPAHGKVELQNGQWIYTASSSFDKEDFLLFQADNGRKSQLGWIRFTKD